MRTRLVIELALAACLSLRPATAVAQVATACKARRAKCAALSSLQVPGFALAITKADAVAAGPAARGRGATINLPAHCRVEGTIDRRIGAEGRRTASASPSRCPTPGTAGFCFRAGWTERHRRPSARRPGRGDSPALVRGFAVVSTDTGHQASGGAFDAAFMRDQQAVLDFEYVAVRTGRRSSRRRSSRGTTGGPPNSYFAGCSTGGREAC